MLGSALYSRNSPFGMLLQFKQHSFVFSIFPALLLLSIFSLKAITTLWKLPFAKQLASSTVRPKRSIYRVNTMLCCPDIPNKQLTLFLCWKKSTQEFDVWESSKHWRYSDESRKETKGAFLDCKFCNEVWVLDYLYWRMFCDTQITYKVLVILHYLMREGNCVRVVDAVIKRPSVLDASRIKNKSHSEYSVWMGERRRGRLTTIKQHLPMYKTSTYTGPIWTSESLHSDTCDETM